MDKEVYFTVIIKPNIYGKEESLRLERLTADEVDILVNLIVGRRTGYYLEVFDWDENCE